MKTTTVKFENDQFTHMYRQVARTIHDNLPFGMKDEYDIDLISEILEMEDKYMADMRILGKTADPALDKSYHKDMIHFIIDRLNDRFVFPTCSDIIKILSSELGQLVNMGICVRKVA